MALHLTPALEQRLQQLATQVRQDSESLAQEGLERYLTHREELERAVETGRAAARRGELIDHEDAMEQMDRILRQ